MPHHTVHAALHLFLGGGAAATPTLGPSTSRPGPAQFSAHEQWSIVVPTNLWPFLGNPVPSPSPCQGHMLEQGHIGSPTFPTLCPHLAGCEPNASTHPPATRPARLSIRTPLTRSPACEWYRARTRGAGVHRTPPSATNPSDAARTRLLLIGTPGTGLDSVWPVLRASVAVLSQGCGSVPWGNNCPHQGITTCRV